MAHDLWRQLRILAVERAESILERPITQFEFAVDSHPHNCPDSLKEHSIRLALDDEAFYRKLAAAYENHRVRPFVDKMLASFWCRRVSHRVPVSHVAGLTVDTGIETGP